MESDVLKVIDAASAWLDIDGVEGVAQGSKDGEVCIVVGCSCPPADLEGQIPASFRGYPVVFESWGIVSAQTDE
jgi:hypothetical protein